MSRGASASRDMRRLLLLLLALPALAGCAETVDADNAEREIASGYVELVPTADVRSVDCPDDISAENGTKARCTLTLARDVRLDVDVRVTGEDGNIRWETVGGTLPGDLVEQRGAEALAARTGQAPDAIACPERVDMELGSRTRCELTADERTYGVTITITDAAGGFDIEVDERPTIQAVESQCHGA